MIQSHSESMELLIIPGRKSGSPGASSRSDDVMGVYSNPTKNRKVMHHYVSIVYFFYLFWEFLYSLYIHIYICIHIYIPLYEVLTWMPIHHVTQTPSETSKRFKAFRVVVGGPRQDHLSLSRTTKKSRGFQRCHVEMDSYVYIQYIAGDIIGKLVNHV